MLLQPNEYKQRRMSDPSQALNGFMQGARRAMQKSRSEATDVDSIGTDWQEVEAGTLQDGMLLKLGTSVLKHLGYYVQPWL